MIDSLLSPRMSQVLDALSSGANLTQAAAAAGVHRNTIANWRHESPQFQEALAQVRADRVLMFRERAEELADLAFASIREILSDSKASQSVRLKAAIFFSKPPWASLRPKPEARSTTSWT